MTFIVVFESSTRNASLSESHVTEIHRRCRLVFRISGPLFQAFPEILAGLSLLGRATLPALSMASVSAFAYRRQAKV